MSEKRRDSKGRILRTGESQRKDGRYAYKYTDACGKTQFVYAWKLVPTDKTPTGKRDDVSLREKVKGILRDLNDGIDTIGKKMTVCQLYARQNSHRKNVKRSTEKGREYLMSVLKEDPLGSRSIDSVKLSDAKEWAIRMSEKGYAYKTVSNWKRSLKAAFYTAIEDDCIRKNPFNFVIADVLEDDTEEKAALTQEQEDRLLAFAGSDPVYRKYCDEIIILLGTGLRVSELCGLTTDLDFENRCIHVDHQLLRDSELGYYVDEPKTKKGARQIPMSEKVYQALKRAVKNRGKASPVNIGGYTNFLFLNQSGLPKTASCYESMFQGLVRKYNKHHKPDEALPNITPHTMRHTFCTRLAQAGMNPKDLQYIMGHSNITMTLNFTLMRITPLQRRRWTGWRLSSKAGFLLRFYYFSTPSEATICHDMRGIFRNAKCRKCLIFQAFPTFAEI